MIKNVGMFLKPSGMGLVNARHLLSPYNSGGILQKYTFTIDTIDLYCLQFTKYSILKTSQETEPVQLNFRS